MEGFGLRLENLREKAGYSKKELSRLLDYTDNVYGHYERGERSPTLETIVKLAELLDTSPNELILGKKNDGKHYKLFEELIDIFAKNGIRDPFFLQIDKWTALNEEHLKEISDHFEWVVEKARRQE